MLLEMLPLSLTLQIKLPSKTPTKAHRFVQIWEYCYEEILCCYLYKVINFTKYQLVLNEYNHKLFQTIIKPKETLNTKTSIYIANLGKLVTI